MQDSKRDTDVKNRLLDSVGEGKVGGTGVQDGGTHVHSWQIHIDVWQNPPQYCKAIILQLK